MKYLFVVGFPRSGTTMLASWLDRFPQIASTPETRFFSDLYSIHFEPRKPIAKNLLIAEAKKRARLADLGLDLDEVATRLPEGKLARPLLLRAMLDLFGERHAAEIVVEKSPIHSLHIDEILEYFPEARVIGIVRDGRDCLLSLKRVRWATRPLLDYALDWAYRNRKLRAAAEAARDRVHIVRFEDFVADEGAAARALKAFALGDPDAVPDSASAASKAVPEWEKAWKQKAQGPIDAGRVEQWRQAGPDFQAWTNTVMGTELSRWGYESTSNHFASAVLGACFIALHGLRDFKHKFMNEFVGRRETPEEAHLQNVARRNDN